MKKPTKTQLVNAVTHYQTGLNSLLQFLTGGGPDDGEVLTRVRDLVYGAPSLEPQAKSLVAEVEENPVATQLTAEVDASEEPASV